MFITILLVINIYYKRVSALARNEMISSLKAVSMWVMWSRDGWVKQLKRFSDENAVKDAAADNGRIRVKTYYLIKYVHIKKIVNNFLNYFTI